MKIRVARLYPALRLSAVILAAPLIGLCIALYMLWHPIVSVRRGRHVPLRLCMSVMDWVHGFPIGYSYWERYQGPALLDEIVVHHHEDSAS